MACDSESHTTLTKNYGTWLPYGHGFPQVWEKLKSKYFLRNGGKLEKVTSDGCLFSLQEYVSLSKSELDRCDVILSMLLLSWNQYSLPIYFSFFT